MRQFGVFVQRSQLTTSTKVPSYYPGRGISYSIGGSQDSDKPS
jgi:hypothetical protein